MAAGLDAMLWVGWRTGARALIAWCAGLALTMVITVIAMARTYSTPEQIHDYAVTVGSGTAIRMLNGDVAGIDSFGGIVANEFGFVASFAVPLMAIALVTRATRREEEAGRLELLLSTPMGRHAPAEAAVITASLAFLATGAACVVAMWAAGVPAAAAAYYGAALAALGLVFVGVAIVAAQLFAYTRTVWAFGLGVAVAAYLVRGVAAATGSGLTWLSPLGWFDGVRAMGHARAWPLGISVLVAAALCLAARALEDRRDLGGALVPSRAVAPRAPRSLMRPAGLAFHQHRTAIIGWSVGAAALLGTYGALTRQVIDAMRSNPALQAVRGTGPDVGVAETMGLFAMVLGMVMSGFVIQSLAALRREEASGRLERELSDPISRGRWLGHHAVATAVGAVLVGAAGMVALAVASAASLGRTGHIVDLVTRGAAYLCVAALFAGLALALFGLRPGAQPAAWGVFAAAALVGYMGPGLHLPRWLIDASPLAAVGDVPAHPPRAAGIAALLAFSAILVKLGVVGFRRRDVPHE